MIEIQGLANSRYNSGTLNDRTFNTLAISSNKMDNGIGSHNYNKFLSNAKTHYSNFGSNSAYVGYYLWHDSTNIYVFLSFVAQTQKGGIGKKRGAEASINYKGITFHSSFSLQSIKNNLNNALNKEINLTSDYSGSLEDKNNINDPTGKGKDLTTLLTTTIKNVLGNEYSKWEWYIQPFSFNNSTRKATTVFKFKNSNTGNQEIWTFETPINIKLSENYWGKSLSARLNFFPGQIVNPNDSTQGMVSDKPIQLEPEVDFWTTIHSIHLKNYLVDYKKLDVTKIKKLNFEQVSSYWKEYNSDIIAQRIPPDPNPSNFVDISGNFPAIKMNEIDTNKIRSLVLAYAQNYINQKASGAKLGIDYYVVTKEGIDISSNVDALKPLLDNATEPKYLNIIIKTKQFSSILIGEANGSIKNSRNYYPEKVKDLSKIKFNDQKFNFGDFSIEEMKNWIIKYINLGLKKSDYTDLVFNKDYGISINDILPTDENHNNIPGYFNDEIFSDFLNNLENYKKITFIVYANDASDLAEGKTEFVLENYIDGNKPNPNPTNPTNPVDPIDPNPNPIDLINLEMPTSGDKKYLGWLLPVIIIPIIEIIIGIVWFYFRFKKRIR